MELSESIEKLKNLQDWYNEGNMSTTIESSELEALCIVLQALENSISKDKLVEIIDFGVKATNTNDDYSIGMCNGMLYIKSVILDKDIEYKKRLNNTYEFGSVVGTKRERDYWKNKIKEKIVNLKVSQENTENDNLDRKYQYQIDILQELLKGE